MLIEIIIALVILLIIFYKWLTIRYDYYKNLDIPFAKPIPFMGSFYRWLIKRESLREEFLRNYLQFKDHKAWGFFEGRNPVLVVNDLDLIKNVTIKHFDYFKNHKSFIEDEDDPLFGNSIFALKDEKWHDMRITLSPAFTGNKMRLMLNFILDICSKGIEHLKKNGDAEFEINMKDFFGLYGNDTIASVAFGLQTTSLENSDCQFYKMGKKLTTFGVFDILKIIMNSLCKPLFKATGLSLGKPEVNKYFFHIITDAMKYRKEHNIIRPDMVNMLMEAKSNPEKSHNREWTDEELVAQCILFFFAGLESVSTTLCFATQELIENLDIQEKLRNEIDSVNDELNGQPLTYEIINKMKYMDMFLSEVLRIWPPFFQTDRLCTKSYQINEDDLKITINPGEMIWIPLLGFHMNEENFPNPNKFDPERFSDENKVNIKPMSYAPFGYGPRICIGSRLALIECKAILFHILTNYKLVPCSKSKIPAVLEANNFPSTIKGGFWLKMVARNKN